MSFERQSREGREVKGMNRVIMMLVAVLLTLAVASAGFAGETFKGTVTKIDGDTITVKTADGKELTGKGDAKTMKIGDKVFVNHGKVSTKRIIDRH